MDSHRQFEEMMKTENDNTVKSPDLEKPRELPADWRDDERALLRMEAEYHADDCQCCVCKLAWQSENY